VKVFVHVVIDNIWDAAGKVKPPFESPPAFSGAASPLAAGTALFGGSTIIAIPVIRRAAAEEANVSGVKTQVQ